MSVRLLRDVFSVRGRFHRSVQLERDWQEQRGLRDYLLTPTARELASQIVHGALESEGPRAWSITGPYGTGKSAFALFLTDLLARETPQHVQARRLRTELALADRSFAPVPVVGQRAPLGPELLASLSIHVEYFLPQPEHQKQHHDPTTGNGHRALSAEFQRLAAAAQARGYAGLLVIVDEFGKFLEYAAQNPDSEDLLLVQDLAETAARNDVPIILLTILHSAFDDYLGPLDEARRVEWQKVQGRFADVAFLEPPEQFLRLIGAAIECNDSEPDICRSYADAATDLANSNAAAEASRRMALEVSLPACAPLHPWTALLLWPLFRSKLAQNERSLFAFLLDRGPFSFQDFLGSVLADAVSPVFYTVDLLYDYIATTLGPATLLGNRARRWAEIAYAVDRVPANAPTPAWAVVKTIGLIGLYGAPVGLRASLEVLRAAVGEPDEVSEAIDYLERLSIVVYRRHESAYGLWEGSDVDLEEAYETALQNVGKGRLAKRLKRAVILRPQVAKAHYIRTGTLRYFAVDVVDGSKESIRKSLEGDPSPADGRITFVLTHDPSERNELVHYAIDMTLKSKIGSAHLQLLAFPKPIVGLEKALLEVEAWNWVEANTQSLQGDPVAKAEVKSRITLTQQRLREIAGPTINLRGYSFAADASDWIQAGRRHAIASAIGFQKWLSRLCDEVYDKTPPLHNELLNREKLSSIATAARRRLLECMIENAEEFELGIQGTPAEYSMYRAMLAAGGFHRETDGLWHFAAPDPEWLPVWNAIEVFMEATESGRRPISLLIELLKLPPYGLRNGAMPVLLCSYFLSQKDELALYEDGLFVPELRIEVFERLSRLPETFEVQKQVLTVAEREVFVAVADMMLSIEVSTGPVSSADLLGIVRPLVVFAAQLPEYSQRTKHIEPTGAVKLRDALLSARDPFELMFKKIPSALDVSIADESKIPMFVERLRAALKGLQNAYQRLLDNLEQQVREALGLHGNSEEAKQQLASRAVPLVGYAADRTLDLFVREASRLDERDWREVLARVVNRGMPPTHWHDADVVDFQVRLKHVASDFFRLEELVAERQVSGSAPVFRVGWLDGQLEEVRAIISIPPEHRLQVEELARKLEDVLKAEYSNSSDGYRLRLAAISKVAQRLLQDSEEFKHE